MLLKPIMDFCFILQQGMPTKNTYPKFLKGRGMGKGNFLKKVSLPHITSFFSLPPHVPKTNSVTLRRFVIVYRGAQNEVSQVSAVRSELDFTNRRVLQGLYRRAARRKKYI